ncbi:MAG: TonB-dependent receptor plug domain-containing protein [Saprospiraceae bacterium]|nr:TonB-dependent receptor plug domain-containing protein [Saprospiraceae bacterium]
MRTIKFKGILIPGLIAILLSSCASTAGDQLVKRPDVDQQRIIEHPTSLRDFLVKAGVTIDYQSGVPIIKGGYPLYVVDGVRMGHDYYQVARTVNVNDIASVEVVRSTAQALIYGRDAGNGVILIKTKVGV